MRKEFAFVSFLVILFLSTGLIFGCGQSTDTTTTTTTTTLPPSSSELVNTSKAGAMFASSGNNMADVASNSQAPSVSSLSVLDVRAASGPPSSFFNPPDANGYVTVDGFHASETVKVRYVTEGGDPVDPDYLSDKTIAILEDFDWDTMFTGSGTSPTRTQVLTFAGSPTYEAATTIADYITWSFTAPQTEAGWRQDPGVETELATNHFTNPTPEALDKVDAMEGVVTLSNEVTGTLNMNITVKSEDDYGMPTGGTGSGTLEVPGTVEAESITLTATMEVTFTDEGSNESLSVTGTTADNYTLTMNCVADGSGTGAIKDGAGTTIATMEITVVGQDTEVTVYTEDGSYTYNL